MKWKLTDDEPVDAPNILTAMAEIRAKVGGMNLAHHIYLDPVGPTTDFAWIMQVGGHFLGTITEFPGGPAVKYALCHLANAAKVPPIEHIAASVFLSVTSEEVKGALALTEQQFHDFQGKTG